MEPRTKRILIISTSLFIIGSASLLLFYILSPKLPSTQKSDQTVIIDNYSKYTEHISSDSFGDLGNYLYEFIKDPSKGVYHSNIDESSYKYTSDSMISKFIVKLEESDISWNISLQTTKAGEINGDISVTCHSGSCISFEDKMNSKPALQDHLPITTSDYMIAYQKANYDSLSIIYYDQDNVGKTLALEKIRSLGFKPEDYKIEYFYGGH